MCIRKVPELSEVHRADEFGDSRRKKYESSRSGSHEGGRIRYPQDPGP